MEVLKKILDFILMKQIIAPIIIIIVSMIIWKIAKRLVNKIFNNRIKRIDPKKQKTIKGLVTNAVKVFIILIASLMILEIYGIDTQSLVASLGIAGLVIGLALQDFLKDFVAGMTIIFENQYCVGDTVTLNGFKGEVIYLSMKTTRIKSFDGQVMILANRLITEVINHTLENSLAIIDIDVSYDTDLDKAEKIIKEACEKLSKEIDNLTGNIECAGVQSLNDSSITFRITAPTKSQQNFQVERILRKEFKKVLDKNKIEIPFPQMVIHNGK